MKRLAALVLCLCLLLTACSAPTVSETSESASYEQGTTEAMLNGDLTVPEAEDTPSATAAPTAAPTAETEPDGPAARVHVSEPTLICADKDMPFTLDGSMCTLRQEDGSMLYWETANGSNVPPFLMYAGTEENPLESRVGLFEWDFGSVRHNRASTLWVQSLYQYEDGTLLGFVHREDLVKNNDEGKNNFWIGLGVSFDGGYHWTYLGDILGTPMNWKMTDADGQPNMGGVPYVVADGYFYVYYNEYITKGTRYIGMARFSVDEALACAKAGTLPEVYKLGNDGFNVDPMEGYSVMVVPGSSDGCMDTHADAAYCEPLGMYLMTVQTHGKGKLWMYLSADGIHWDDRVLIDEVEPNTRMHPYSFFVGLEGSSADSSTVGERFYLYFPRKGISGLQYAVDDLYRVEITVDPA